MGKITKKAASTEKVEKKEVMGPVKPLPKPVEFVEKPVVKEDRLEKVEKDIKTVVDYINSQVESRIVGLEPFGSKIEL